MLKAYPLIPPRRMEIDLEGIRVLYIRWRKRKITKRLFKFLEEKFGGFPMTWEGKSLEGCCITGRRHKSMIIGRWRPNELEIILFPLQDTLPIVQILSWWKWDKA